MSKLYFLPPRGPRVLEACPSCLVLSMTAWCKTPLTATVFPKEYLAGDGSHFRRTRSSSFPCLYPTAHNYLSWVWARLHPTTIHSESQKHTDESKKKPLCLLSANERDIFTQIGSFQWDCL